MTFLKHLLLLISVSIIIIFTMSFLHPVLQGLLHLQQLVMHSLDQILAQGPIALMLKNLLGMLVIPVGITAIIGGIYWIFKRSMMPYLIHIMWTIWLILAVMTVS